MNGDILTNTNWQDSVASSVAPGIYTKPVQDVLIKPPGHLTSANPAIHADPWIRTTVRRTLKRPQRDMSMVWFSQRNPYRKAYIIIALSSLASVPPTAFQWIH